MFERIQTAGQLHHQATRQMSKRGFEPEKGALKRILKRHQPIIQSPCSIPLASAIPKPKHTWFPCKCHFNTPFQALKKRRRKQQQQSICRKSQTEHTYTMLHNTVYTSMPSIKYHNSIAYTDMCRDSHRAIARRRWV